jgi:hypothetical protein
MKSLYLPVKFSCMKYVIVVFLVFWVKFAAVGQRYVFEKRKNDRNEISFALLNYANPISITQNKKLELGIQLPNELQKKIDNYVRKSRSGDKVNPYLEWELRVYAVFKHEQSGEEITIDGFYTQEYTTWSADKIPLANNTMYLSNEIYATLGGYHQQTTDYPFRIRFSPTKQGKWSCTINAKASKFSFVSATEIFEVAPSNYTFISIDKNNRFFEKNNKSFMPIGCNVVWPTTTEQTDPELFAYMNQEINGVNYIADEGYRTTFPIPRVYEKYREHLNLLCDNGVNNLRLIMSPVSTDIEWEELGNYTNRLQMAQEMDQIFELAENRGVLLHLCLQAQMIYQNHGPANYYANYAWNGEMHGVHFCYYNLLNGKNAQYFLEHEESKKYYKQRLRYILSRWGYSHSLSVLDLVGEINQIGNNETTDASGENTYTANPKIYEAWQQEMAAYLKTLYYGKNHYISTTYAGRKAINDNTFASPDMEIMGSNLYDFGATNFFTHIASFSKAILNDDSETSYTSLDGKKNVLRKPFMLMEFDAIDVRCDQDKVDGMRAQWQVLFSGVNGSFSWMLWAMPSTFHHYGKMNTWMNTHFLAGKDWHPGASERKADGSWVYNKAYFMSMDGWFLPPRALQKRNKKADVSYLRSGDKKTAFGVISNKTYNIYAVSDCIDSLYNFKDKNGNAYKENNGQGNWYVPPSLRVAENINTLNEKLRLEGMEKGEYDIYYYTIDNQTVPFATSNDSSSNGVDLNVVLKANAKEYLILFKAVKRE